MLPIAAVSRDVPGLAGLDVALTMPRMTVPSEVLVFAAGAMAEAAARREAAFIEHGLAPDFVASLRSAASELAAALGARDGTQRRRIDATRNQKQLAKRGRRALRLLNAALRPRLAHDPSLLAAWDNVRRVKEGAGGPAAAPEATAPAGDATQKVAKQAT